MAEMKIAIMGFGTVGSGVAQVLRDLPRARRGSAARLPELKYVVELRPLDADNPFAPLQIRDAEIAFSDPEIALVVETIGGTRAAYELTKAALTAGKHVVTSNKALVARHGVELLELAAEKGVYYLFEASVGGGIPIIAPLKQSLAANEVLCIAGILNGTTNYILTRMVEDGVDFDDALAEASARGYAELDPSADIEGSDTARKIAILCSVAYDVALPYEAGLIEGITQVTPHELKIAEQAGYVLKLLAYSLRDAQGRLGLKTALHLIPREDPLAAVHGVTNAVLVSGSAVGDVMFAGPGAGSLATASAVVADILEALNCPLDPLRALRWTEARPDMLIPAAELPVTALLVPCTRQPGEQQSAELAALGAEYNPRIGAYGAYTVGRRGNLTEAGLSELLAELTQAEKWLSLRIFRERA